MHSCKRRLELGKRLASTLEDLEGYLELYREEQPDESDLAELAAELERFEATVVKAELATFLKGKYDANNAYISIHPGAGGTESCDWAQMLLRMYIRWIEREGYEYEQLDLQPGEQAGIKSATILVKGDYIYGYLKSERGVHRLVRISPFDSNARRHTSFCSVDVYPEVEDDLEIEINPKDLRIDTFRASSAGGQHVNKADSAVRITHLPTGIVVSCQNERSQHANRNTAMKILKARLLERKIKEQEEKLAKERGTKLDIAWGSQIRSYILQPYTLVKDHRTGEETSNVEKVLDGDISRFIRAYLLWEGKSAL